MKKYLYGASVQGIQEFIFTTNELKSIVGASEIVKNINTKVAQQYKNNIIINAAGNIKLLFDEKEKNLLETLVQNFVKETKQSAYGITISQAVVAFESGNLKKAFEELERKLYIQRNKVDIPLDMSINILNLAPKTAKPIVANSKNKDMATLSKEEANTSTGDIPKNSKNKTAIIHADGNGLGAMIASMSKDIKDDTKIITLYKEFSTKLDIATHSAFTTAKKNIKNPKDIREVILGGDDMTVICNANDALKFTQKYLEEFEKETQKVFENEGLSACAGIAYANHKYPFHYALNLAESLCSYAKKHSKEIVKDRDSIAPSSLMFHNIQSSNFSDYEEYIDKELTLKNDKESIFLNYGPYFTQEQKDYSTISSFINLAGALAQKGSPMSRLREWLTILGENSIAAQERLHRINEMMDLKSDIYNKKILEKNLYKFNSQMKLNDLTHIRDEIKYSPIGDIDSHLSVIDWSK